MAGRAGSMESMARAFIAISMATSATSSLKPISRRGVVTGVEVILP